MMLRVRGPDAVRSANERGIQWNDIHQHAKAELLFQEFGDDLQFRGLQVRVDKQLDRIVTRLAVNIDATREIRREPIVEPVIVSEPGVLRRDRDQVPRTFMIYPILALLSRAEDLHAAVALQHLR